MPTDFTHERALTPNEFARRYRLSPDRVRAMIRRGELGGLNISPHRPGKPQFIITPEHVREFERRRQVSPSAKATPRRKRRSPGAIDFYPDTPAEEGGSA